MSAIAANTITAEDIEMTIPTASEVEQEQEQEVQEESQLTLEQVQDYLPHLEVSDLLDILTTVNSLLKKKWKEPKKKVSAAAPRKVSPALLRNQAWLAYVQKYAMNNGWKAFTIRQETTDKETGEKVVEETERSASKPNDASPPYTFKDAKTKETITPAHIFQDTGKHLIYKEAMSLSAQWKWATGEKPALKFRDESEEQEHWSDLFRGFVEEYNSQQPVSDEESSSSSSSSSSTPSSPTVRRLSAVEKEEERAERRRIAEEEKEAKRQAREEKKEQSRLKKEKEEQEKEARRLEREAKKAQKEKEAEEKAAEKAKKASPPAAAVKKAIVPAKTASPASASSTKTVTPAPAKVPAPAAAVAAAPVVKKIVAKAPAPKQLEKPKMTLDVPKDDLVHDWTWEGVTYLVNSDGCVWKREANGEAGPWVGMIDLNKQIIDTSVEEPVYDDDE
jgi:hypothetical protein